MLQLRQYSCEAWTDAQQSGAIRWGGVFQGRLLPRAAACATARSCRPPSARVFSGQPLPLLAGTI